MIRTALAIVCLVLVGCGRQGDAGDPAKAALFAAPQGPLVASVNGEALSEPLLAAFARGRGLDPGIPEQRQEALDGLIDATLLAQDALANGVAGGTEAQAELLLLRLQYLGNQALADYRDKLEITDAKVLEYYQQEAQRAGSTEWRLEHILLADEATAREVAARASAPGADFGALMNEYAGTARQAKSLDWAIPSRLPTELAEVAAELPDGMVAPAPIQTAYGWHVLRKAESRPFAPPAFDTVRDAARQQMIERALKDYVSGLRTKSEIATGASTPAAG